MFSVRISNYPVDRSMFGFLDKIPDSRESPL